MKKIISFVLVIILSGVTLAFAETTIKAEIDKKILSAGETLTYKLTIAFSSKNIPQPQFPKFKDFYCISEAESSTISFQEAGAKTILVYAFILTPKNAGKFSIEPAQVREEGKIYASEGFEIEVSPSKPKNNPPDTQEPKITL